MCDRRYDVICKYLACAEKLTGGQLRLCTYCMASKLKINGTGRSANADCIAFRVSNVKHASFRLGVGAFKPTFYGKGSSSAKMLIPFYR